MAGPSSLAGFNCCGGTFTLVFTQCGGGLAGKVAVIYQGGNPVASGTLDGYARLDASGLKPGVTYTATCTGLLPRTISPATFTIPANEESGTIQVGFGGPPGYVCCNVYKCGYQYISNRLNINGGFVAAYEGGMWVYGAFVSDGTYGASYVTLGLPPAFGTFIGQEYTSSCPATIACDDQGNFEQITCTVYGPQPYQVTTFSAVPGTPVP